MVVCFLAFMKAGCPYVPIDGNYVPPQRTASIATQIRASMSGDLSERVGPSAAVARP